jgi:predicted glycogen debranching enzyme
MLIHLPRRICADLDQALEREWLVTNGLGGFAAGTVAGALTRRYHGLLFAAVKPPVERVLLAAKLDETVLLRGQKCQLYTNVWASGIEQPTACRWLQRFDLNLNIPTWTFVCNGARLTKRIWMEHGHNVTYVRYALDAASPPLTLSARLLVNDRNYHQLAPGGAPTFKVHVAGQTLETRASETAVPLHARAVGAGTERIAWQVDYTWCHDFELPIEAARGYDHRDSHLVVGTCTVQMTPGAAVTFILAAGDDHAVDPSGALERYQERARGCLAAWQSRLTEPAARAPLPLQQLVLAADQFIVRRPAPDAPDGHTVIAGYPWFTDWGRDTMIALPGLTLVTGRPDIARQILRTWARYVSDGMIPNRFPDESEQPAYNTADATLWYLWAIDQYVRATGDVALLTELFPVMADIVAWHRRGTRHNVRIDADGLVYQGEPGLALTWMDAKVDGRVITPRIGKPVELAALWYDALCNLARLADLVEQPGAEYVRLAETTRKSFGRFWNPAHNCCRDVLDGPAGDDPAIRPNQIFAASLCHSPLARVQQAAVVELCERKLLTWFGLRSLASDERAYHSRYRGRLVERDEAYHQGTAWGWLLGPLVIAHYRLHHDAAHAGHLLQPLYGQLYVNGVGSLAEVFDGDQPHTPGGCPQQAWSVAETLRAWWVTHAPAFKGT